MMKMRRFLSLLSVMMLMLLVCMTAVSCSNNFKKVPQTGFVTHHVKNGDSHIPFDAYWNAPDEKAWNERVKGEHGKENLLAVASVDTGHMDVRPDTPEGQEALRDLAEYFRKSVNSQLEKTAEKPLISAWYRWEPGGHILVSWRSLPSRRRMPKPGFS